LRTLILGGAGMLGRAIAVEGRSRGSAVLALSRAQADVTDRERVLAAAASFRPELIVNCAALTRVDDCEERRDEAFAVNGRAVANVVAAAAAAGSALVQVSTDYVFDGRSHEPYDEGAAPAPLSVYGASKRAGEEVALAYPRGLIVRTSWLFGPGGPNFVRTIAGRLEAGERRLRVVDDQLGCPTYTPFLAGALWELAPLDRTGIVHVRHHGPVTWHGLAREIVRRRGADCEVEPISSAEAGRAAVRPSYSVLAVDLAERALGRRLEDWDWGLGEYLDILRRRSEPRSSAAREGRELQ
jgi:dTDP-4-dehydrorhamnose reductase